jgi:hypothetical protein
MPRLPSQYSLWLILFALGIVLDVLGFAITWPPWLHYMLIAGGVLLILISITLIGRMQHS